MYLDQASALKKTKRFNCRFFVMPTGCLVLFTLCCESNYRYSDRILTVHKHQVIEIIWLICILIFSLRSDKLSSTRVMRVCDILFLIFSVRSVQSVFIYFIWQKNYIYIQKPFFRSIVNYFQQVENNVRIFINDLLAAFIFIKNVDSLKNKIPFL